MGREKGIANGVHEHIQHLMAGERNIVAIAAPRGSTQCPSDLRSAPVAEVLSSLELEQVVGVPVA